MTFGYAAGAYPFGAGWREAEDVRAACAWVASETGAPALAWGFSAGAHAAVLAGSVPGPLCAVVSDSPVVDLSEVVRSECARRSHLPRVAFGPLRWMIALMAGARPVDLSRHGTPDVYPVPVLVVHAGRDDIVSPEAAEVVRRATGGQAWEVAGAAHAQGYRFAPSAYFTRVQRLMEEVEWRPPLTRPAP
jgi:acetyl esterase/lipase